METLTVGCLAYLDSFAGLIPCKVIEINNQRENGIHMASLDDCITIKLTASRGQFKTWKQGEVLTESGLHVIPRKSVTHSGHIKAYQVETPA